MDRLAKKIALLILLLMFLLMFFSSWNESATFDEVAHIPAGYSYLKKQDYRLNPEHPPLIKDLAALPLLFLNLNFPDDIAGWNEKTNERQWKAGNAFLYETGNNPDKIIFWARLPIMLLAVFFGWLLFRWTRGLYGAKVALLTLFFFALSPSFIAHSRYVTTDLAAAFGFFLGIVYFVKFLKNQTNQNLIIAGIVFGLAELLKFSLVLLGPIYLILAVLWALLSGGEKFRFSLFLKQALKTIGKTIVIGLVGTGLIWLVYGLHTAKYPPATQLEHTKTIVGSQTNLFSQMVVFAADKPALRAIGHYLLGILMVVQRSAGGNNAYFLGEVSNQGWWYYFPLLYLLKEQLAFHIFTIIALGYAVSGFLKSRESKKKVFFEWMKDNFALTAGIVFIMVYWTQSLTSPLNIGLRHLMPIFPFIYLLVARETVRWLGTSNFLMPQNMPGWMAVIYVLRKFVKKAPRYIFLSLLMLWIFASTLMTFPYYLSFYNEIAGVKNGYKIATDSNYDWGQDLKRLKDFVEKNNIGEIKIDYFGGGSPGYYLGEKFEPWWSAKGPPPQESWLAVSINQSQGAMAKPVKGFEIKPEDSYSWLKAKEPVARAGTSIFIYKF